MDIANLQSENKSFTIKNLVCSHNGIDPVLFVPYLEIPNGKICALFGKSGSGKTTLLEVLGLMTDSIARCKKPYTVVNRVENEKLNKLKANQGRPIAGIELFQPEDEIYIKFHSRGEDDIKYFNYKFKELPDKQHSLKKLKKDHEDIWGNPLRQQLLRHDHFSFIFQNFNLMPNFTAIENVAIPEMIKSNDEEKTSLDHAKATLISDLEIAQRDTEKLPTLLSGGQKQRVAFARAINSKFSILFGDEPTGNLDQYNSRKLVEHIRERINGYSKNYRDEHYKKKTSIIVTHDIGLTLNFADYIIPIKTVAYKFDPKDPESETMIYGKINPEDVFYSKFSDDEMPRRMWFNKIASGSDDEIEIPVEDMKRILLNILESEI